MSKLNANSVDPDQMPHSATSDLGLHCLPISHLWDTRHKWVDPLLLNSNMSNCNISFPVQHILTAGSNIVLI